MAGSNTSLSLAFCLTFNDLYHNSGLEKIDENFRHFLQKNEPELAATYEFYRANPIDDIRTRKLLIELTPYLEEFIGDLFNIKKEIQSLQEMHHDLAPIFNVKRQFVQRIAIRKYNKETAETFDHDALRNKLGIHIYPFTELAFAKQVQQWSLNEETYTEILDISSQYAAWATLSEEGQIYHKNDVLFKQPHKLDFQKLVPFHLRDIFKEGNPKYQRRRTGFDLTDRGFTLSQSLDQANYCIWCSHQSKDSCSKGMKPKSDSTEKFIKNWANLNLAGCPLEEKISEMNESKAKGYTLGALAIAVIDNPMVAATGHRICNDCMKACIYQKQEPVNIPGIETQILKDVLKLPWGFEIYSLLTRWNPLNFHRPLPKPESGYKVLVVGTGPAGFTLSHYLLNEGHAVVAIDGLKIEPLSPQQSGVDAFGHRIPFTPIYSLQELEENLGSRVTSGFGGVAEYGITVRWDKNFLKIIRLLLERRQSYALFGGIRFGGTLSIDQVFDLGFDHIALCMGAGSPTLIPMKNNLAIGVRQASDFLMALQLAGAAKEDSLANLQLRLPAVVIGGGLTAIDTATEAMAYYPVQVEKFYLRYQELCEQSSTESVRSAWTESELVTVDEYLSHGKIIFEERQLATKENRQPNFQSFVKQWGGVTLAYRRDIKEAPSYTLNHEEVTIALEEGIQILDHATPIEITIDALGQAESLVIKHHEEIKLIPARTILIAAGTKPNTNLKYDEKNYFSFSGQTFQAIDESGQPASPEKLVKPDNVHVLISIQEDQKAISFFGDMHPSFAGNVVKAMGSAKQGYPVISRILSKRPQNSISTTNLFTTLNQDLRAYIHAVNRLTPTIMEVVIHAPFAARNFKPGQFYRLQNYEIFAPIIKNTRFVMEGIALTGASVDLEKGLLSTIVLEMGGSSDLCQFLKPGDPVILMGPTGEPTEIPTNETVMLVGGGLGNAVLFSIGQALRTNGCKVIYFAGYKKIQDRYKVADIEAAADEVIWCCDEAPGFSPTRPQDHTFVGNIVNAMSAYATGGLGNTSIAMNKVKRIIAIGSDRMMAAVTQARKSVLKDYLDPNHIGIGSINSPMQCMMKEICAQCLQRHIDPITGKEKIIYSCSNQDQNLDWVDWQNLRDRLRQNSVQEKLTKQWLQYCIASR